MRKEIKRLEGNTTILFMFKIQTSEGLRLLGLRPLGLGNNSSMPASPIRSSSSSTVSSLPTAPTAPSVSSSSTSSLDDVVLLEEACSSGRRLVLGQPFLQN
jgi:hypothetical protein